MCVYLKVLGLFFLTITAFASSDLDQQFVSSCEEEDEEEEDSDVIILEEDDDEEDEEPHN